MPKPGRNRIFTLDEANGALPFVQRVADDLVEASGRIGKLYARLRQLTADKQPAAKEVEEEIRSLADAIEGCLAEIEQVGCEFKDYRLGLVDFRARLGDRLVYLCWRRGEAELGFWHELDSGFSGRQPVHGHFPSAESRPRTRGARP